MNDKDKLEKLAAMYKDREDEKPGKRGNKKYNSAHKLDQNDMDIWFSEKWIPAHCPESFERTILSDGRIMYKLVDGCVFDRNHKDASIIIGIDGTMGYNCFHDSCSDKHWRDFREVFDSAIHRNNTLWQGRR